MASLAIAIILATTYLHHRWLLDSRVFFHADDWQWFWRSEFLGWNTDAFPPWPGSIYNDRPVGAAFFKALYEAFGVNHLAFQVALLCVHAINSVLLYKIAERYTSWIGALVAALLAATWFSANSAVGWSAAVFDLLGATFCLATVLLRSHARTAGRALPYDLAGALCYLLAVRTKEFAIGMIVVLLVMATVVERQAVRVALRQLWPYLLVFVVLAARYAQLLLVAPPATGDPYAPQLSLAGIVTNLRFFVSALLYSPGGVGPLGMGAMVAAFLIAILLSQERMRRLAIWGSVSFVVLLGPVLLLPARLDALYLYAPHFFLALAIGALIGRRLAPTLFAAVLVAGIVLPPERADIRRNVIAWTYDKGETNRTLYYATVAALTPLPKGATVFIDGVEAGHNPFRLRPGNALNVAFKDYGLTIHVERPLPELMAGFCATGGVRRFIQVEGRRVRDATMEAVQTCAEGS
jgi:hypothetical protein